MEKEDPIPPVMLDLGEEEKEAVQEVMDSGQIAAGPRVKEFEELFSEYLGVKEAVAVNSGTASIHTALLASDVGKDDKVVVPGYSFIASVTPVLMCGAEPLFADIDRDTYCMDPEEVEKLARENDVEAVVPVHLYGHPADMESIEEIAEEFDLTVIEDSCQAHGAEYHGQRTGSLGDIGCFSFYATKNMTTGEGGMLVTDSEEKAEKARSIREHGREGDHYGRLGYNYLMTDIQASIGIEQLKKLEGLNESRRKNAEFLNRRSKEMEKEGLVVRPVEKEGVKHVYHQYALRILNGKEGVVEEIRKRGIGARKGYERPIYEEKAVDVETRCIECERASREVIWLPVFPGLTEGELKRISDTLKDILRSG